MATPRKCGKCGKENPVHYKFCLGCGADVQQAAAEDPLPRADTAPAGGEPGACGACGTRNARSDGACSFCGRPLS